MNTFLYFVKKVNQLSGCHYEVTSYFAYLSWELSSVEFASLVYLVAIAGALC